MDQLNAQIATIESVTREAPENIGNGLKTLYARFADIGMGETLEDGVDLGQVTKTLDKVGVTVLDAEGKMNNVGNIMEQLMDVWSTLDMTQKNAVATTLAGKYQLSRFEALMNRSDLYDEYKEASKNAEGTLDVMNDTYVNSLQGKMNTLQASFEGVLGNLLETDDFYGIIDGLTEVIDLFGELIDAIGGGGQALTAFGAIATSIFSKNMAAGITNMTANFRMKNLRNSNEKSHADTLKELGIDDRVDIKDKKSQDLLGYVQKISKNSNTLTTEQQEKNNQLLQDLVEITNKAAVAETELKAKVEATNIAYRNRDGLTEDIIKQNPDGSYDFSELKKLERDAQDTNPIGSQKDSSMQRMVQDLEILQTDVVSFQEKLTQATNGGEKEFKQLDASLINVDRSVKNLEGSSQVLGKQYQKLIAYSRLLSKALHEYGPDSKEVEQLTAKIKKLSDTMLESSERAQRGDTLNSQMGLKQQNEAQQDESQRLQQLRSNQAFSDDVDFQAKTQAIMNVASAVMELSFA